MASMQSSRLTRSLVLGVAVLALFNTVSGLTMPVAARKPAVAVVGIQAVALVAHALLYLFGHTARARFGMAVYVAAQIALIVIIGMTGSLFPVSLALLAAFTAETIVLAGDRWGAAAITMASIVVYATMAAVSQDLYRGATAGVVLAATGLIAHAVIGLGRSHASTRAANLATLAAQRESRETVSNTDTNGAAHIANAVNVALHDLDTLTIREREVLDALVTGARNGDIGVRLGITERTVKAHLASIYQKLGVSSRAEAIAFALSRSR